MSSDQERNSKHESLNNYLASFLLVFCSVVLVILLCFHSCNYSKNQVLPQKVNIEVYNDATLKNNTKLNKDLSDSLTRIITEHEQLLANHYNKILEEKETDNKILSLGGLVIGIIISILGFFGFKSFQSIEDKAKDTAEENAGKVAKSMAKNYLEENLDSGIEKVIRENFQNSIVQKLRDEVNRNFKRRFDELDDLSNSVTSLEKHIDDLEKDLRQALQKNGISILNTIEEKSDNGSSSTKGTYFKPSKQTSHEELENPFNED